MSAPAPPPSTSTSAPAGHAAPREGRAWRWGATVLAGVAVALLPVPAGVTPAAWRLLAIFIATIVGSVLQPAPGGAVVLLGIAAVALFGVMPVRDALGGYADPIVWLVLAAFFISRGMIKTGLGRRIALVIIRAIGHRSLGLGYALVASETLLATIIPSNSARCSGITFPIAKSLAEAFDSRPGPTARRLGAYLMAMVYQAESVVCAMFLTGQASNVLIAKFAKQVAHVELSYGRWMLGALVPGLLSLLAVPWLVYRLYPPEVRHTPEARALAERELAAAGPMGRDERLMLGVFVAVAALWTTQTLHHIDYATVALLGIGTLLVTGVLDWEDVLAERAAWDVFIWYGGLVRMAEALGQSGIMTRFAQTAAAHTAGWTWWATLGVLLLVYFYAHYFFASITAHATVMYIPFLAVVLTAGAPTWVAVLTLAYFSNLDACLTHYGTTPGPVYFGAGYVPQWTWWRLGLTTSFVTIPIWTVAGLAWWRVLGWW